MNSNQARRDEILGVVNEQYRGGCAYFTNLNLNQLEQLIKEEFIDLEDYQNNAPTARAFYEFMKQHPTVSAHGYAVEAKREDYRVTIEGLVYNGPVSASLASAFTTLCRHADDFELGENHFYSWWD